MQPETTIAVSLVIALIGAVVLYDWLVRKNQKSKDGELGSAHYSEATIANNLAPKLKALMAQDADFALPHLSIVGGDGYPLLPDGPYPWTNFLCELVGKGCTIEYALTNANASIARRIGNSKLVKLGGSETKVQFYFPIEEVATAPADKELLRNLQTFHFALIEGKNGKRAMWIEGYHPQGSTLAYGCKFVAPEAATNDPQYDRYKAAFTRLIEIYRATMTRAKAA